MSEVANLTQSSQRAQRPNHRISDLVDGQLDEAVVLSEGWEGGRLMSLEAVRYVMGVKETCLRQWMQRGELPFFRCGRVVRINSQALLEFIARKTRKAESRNADKLKVRAGAAESDSVLWGRMERLIRLEVGEAVERARRQTQERLLTS